MFTDRVNLAIVLAASVYCDKTRKGTNIPYIAHPVAVGMIIRDYTDEETAIIAGILQGVLELAHPAFYSEADMRRDFGDVITDIVKDVSEPKTTEQSKLPWKERNQSYLKRLSNFHYPEAYIVATANEIHYLTELLNTYVRFGGQIWHRLNDSKYDILQYYRNVFDLIKTEPIPKDLKCKFEGLIDKLEEIVTLNS